jgi:hypothetical protein
MMRPVALLNTVSPLHVFDGGSGDAGPALRRGPVALTFTYTASDPYSIRLLIRPCGGTEVEWELSREALVEAVSTEATTVGEGDVRITNYARADGDEVVIVLVSPTSVGEITCRTHDLVELLDQTEDIVPLGDESAFVLPDASYGDWLDRRALDWGDRG